MKSLLTSVSVDCKCILSQAQFLYSVGVAAECNGPLYLTGRCHTSISIHYWFWP